MEEKETGESEPVDLRCGEQTELLSLIISGEEEATRAESDLGGKGRKKQKKPQCFFFILSVSQRNVRLRGCQSHGHCQAAS